MKRELAKKEGRLLTKKQKEEKAAAERRRQALIASGVQIEGLQQPSGAPSGGKKVTYGSRKKKTLLSKDKDSAPASPAPESRPLSPAPVATPRSPSPAPAELSNKADDVKDEWDASSTEEDNATAPAPGVKDSWDASSEDEESAEIAPLPPPESKSTNEPTVLPVGPPSQPEKGVPPGVYFFWFCVSLFIKLLQYHLPMERSNPQHRKDPLPNTAQRNPPKRSHLKRIHPKTDRRMIQRILRSLVMA